MVEDREATIARVSAYLNFPHCTEEAFGFYRSIFGGDNGMARDSSAGEAHGTGLAEVRSARPCVLARRGARRVGPSAGLSRGWTLVIAGELPATERAENRHV